MIKADEADEADEADKHKVGSGGSSKPLPLEVIPLKLDIGCSDTCARAACAQSLVLQIQSRS